MKQAHADLRAEIKESRPSIEFVPATPLEYLSRWQVCNDLFNDDGNLLPFDIILSEPDDELSDFLKLY